MESPSARPWVVKFKSHWSRPQGRLSRRLETPFRVTSSAIASSAARFKAAASEPLSRIEKSDDQLRSWAMVSASTTGERRAFLRHVAENSSAERARFSGDTISTRMEANCGPPLNSLLMRAVFICTTWLTRLPPPSAASAAANASSRCAMKRCLSSVVAPETKRTSARISSKSTFRFISIFSQPAVQMSSVTRNMPTAMLTVTARLATA